MSRGSSLLLLLLGWVTVFAEPVTLRKVDFIADSLNVSYREFDCPAWSGRTRLVCAQSNCPWSLSLVTDAQDTLSVSLSWRESVLKSFEPATVLDLEATYGGTARSGSVMEKRGVNLSDNDYMLTVTWDMAQGVSVSVANTPVLGGIPLSAPVTGMFVAAPEQPVKFTEWLTNAQTAAQLMKQFTEADIMERITHNDTITGIYRYFDRDTEPAAAQVGGDYTLAVIPLENTGDYALCYMAGATVNRNLWHTGMVKGILTPTDFVGHYNLRWLDADFRIMDAEQYACFPGNNLLELVFPLYKSKFRLVRDVEK